MKSSASGKSIAIGSDECTHLTDFVLQYLGGKGFQLELYGVSIGESTPWPEVAEKVAGRVASRKISEGILFCWTGTGVSIAANKLPGIRAALCPDVATARGARQWNHANVLVMGLRPTSELLGGEILDAWFATPFGGGEDAENVSRVTQLEVKYEIKPRRKKREPLFRKTEITIGGFNGVFV